MKQVRFKKGNVYDTIESEDAPEPATLSISSPPNNKTPAQQSQTIRKYRRTILATALLTAILVIVGFIIITVYYYTQWDATQDDKGSVSCRDRFLVVISLDGFRALTFTDEEFRSRYNITTPNLDKLMSNGVHIKRINPVYPSLTFPNHYTMVTGLYPGYHGIVSNAFFDPMYGYNYNESFQMSINDDKGEWYKGEPIWQTMKSIKNQKKYDFKSATIFWVGSDQNCSGNGYPDFYLKFNNSLKYKRRCDIGVDLLQNGSYRLIMMYFNNPDHIEHLYGPNSEMVLISIHIAICICIFVVCL